MNSPLRPVISTQSRWLGKHAEGLIWPLWLFVVFHLGQERWLHTDSAYTLYRILNHQPLFYDRFACELIVWPGQLLTYLGAPIHWVLQSVNLILPLMAWMAWAATAKSAHRWVFFLLFFIGGSEVFFIGYSEIGLATLAFLATVVFTDILTQNSPSQSHRHKQLVVLILGIATMFLSHPAAWLYMPFLLGLGLAILAKKDWLILGLSLGVVFLLKAMAFPSNAYDSGLYHTLLDPTTWVHFTELWSVNYLVHASWFFIPAITALACLLIGLTKPWRWISILFFGVVAVDAMIALLIYSQGDAHINMEKFFYPIAVVTMMSIPAYLWASQRPKHGEYRLVQLTAKQRGLSHSLIGILPWFLSLNMLLGIQKYSPIYKNRITQVKLLVDQMPSAKMISHYDTLSQRVFPGSLWGLTYETALISCMHSTSISKTHIDENGHVNKAPRTKTIKAMSAEELGDWENIQHRIGDTVIIGAPFEMPQRIDQLNPRYFKFEQGTTYQQWNPAANQN